MQTKMELLQEHAATSRLTQTHPFWANSVSKVALFDSFFPLLEAFATRVENPLRFSGRAEAKLDFRGPRIPGTPCKNYSFVLPDEVHLGPLPHTAPGGCLRFDSLTLKFNDVWRFYDVVDMLSYDIVRI